MTPLEQLKPISDAEAENILYSLVSPFTQRVAAPGAAARVRRRVDIKEENLLPL